MKLEKLIIKNYRLLTQVELEIEDTTTVIVGKNNSGKTSFMDFLDKITSGGKFTFNDYPIIYRNKLYISIIKYLKKEITYEAFIQELNIPSIRFQIDYTLEDENTELGMLSEFIIDTDFSMTKVIIEAQYNYILSEEKFLELFSQFDINDIKNARKEIREILAGEFQNAFQLRVEAVNPSDEEDRLQKTPTDLKNLLPVYKIRAERAMDESDIASKEPISPLLTKLFADNVESTLPEVKESIKKLKEIVKNANKIAQDETDELLTEIVEQAVGFGYPNIEELQLKTKTNLSIEEQIKSNTDLTYIDNELDEILPSKYNGLGYKNLIKIEIELARYAREISENNEVVIPILFIEEPESHMHPQLQQRFMDYLDDYLKKISNKNIQVIITSHSSHVSNSIDFKQIRYIQRRKHYVKYRDLKSFAEMDVDNAAFLQKYMSVTKCDLFFADKVILVEGASERLLLPDMIAKCAQDKLFEGYKPSLNSQFYTILEVGGAYAHKFIPFMQYLGIPTLIITDIDSVKQNQNIRNEKCKVTEGESTSNATIKYWVKKILNKKKEKVTLKDVISLPKELKSDVLCHIAYQTEESGLCGRSLEEAIKNSNRALFDIQDNTTEDDLYFNAQEEKKTEFALNLLCKDYKVPKYITDGLIWLNSQKLYNEEEKNEQ